jgi:hypothetical protein
MSVQAIMDDAQEFARTTTSDAEMQVRNLENRITIELGYTDVSYVGAALPQPLGAPDPLKPPGQEPVNLELPTDPGDAPEFQDIPPPSAGDAPELDAEKPDLDIGSLRKPSQLADFNQSAPSVQTSFAVPVPGNALDQEVEAPTLIDRVAPEKPQIMLPVFSGTPPIDTTVAPTNLEGRMNAAYRDISPIMVSAVNGHLDTMLTKYNPRFHEQMARIETQLAKYLDGGTGLKPAIEDAIYARSRSKQDAESRRARDTAYSEAASRGFTMPTGALMSAVQQSRQAAADNNAAAAREIVVMQAEMEQKNLQFAVTTSAALRSTLLNATLSYMQNLTAINGQALAYAKDILGAIIESYNTAVKAYSLKIELYKSEASVYEVRLKSAMAGVELYKAEIDALQALTNVDRAKVDVYQARIGALSAYVNMYKARVDATVSLAGLEKLKIDLFEAQVQAYSARVQAKNAEWQGYTAQLGGEMAKVQVYKAEVDAYGAKVQGFKSTVEAEAEVVRSIAMTNDARAKQYTATVGAFSAKVSAQAEVAKTQIENQRIGIVAFQAQSQAAIANAQLRNDHMKATTEVALQNASETLKAQLAQANYKLGVGQAIVNVAGLGMTARNTMAAAALSGMNTLAAQLQNE